MDGDDFRDDIARIEARIEELAEASERCRKLSLAAKIMIGAGLAWTALTLLWVIPYVPFMTIAAMAAAIGGVVLLGSNATTWTQTQDALAKSESMRADLIGKMELRVIDGGVRRLH